MTILQWCHWLQNTTWATAIRQSDLGFPFLEGTHILALSLSVGLIAILDLRLLGLAFRDQPVARIMAETMPWALPGFAIMFTTGIVLFITQAEKAYGNNFMRAKFLLLILAGFNALYYQKKFYPRMTEWDEAVTVPAGAKLCGLLSLILWAGIIACGRTMAYEL